MRNCFVPRCDYINRNNPRRMMFMAPKDAKMFETWKSILPKKREFKKIDKVCERHFNKEDIQVTFDHVINGELLQMARGRPRLRPDAVPTHNLDLEDASFKPRPVARRLVRKRKVNENADSIKTEDNDEPLSTEEQSPSKLIAHDNQDSHNANPPTNEETVNDKHPDDEAAEQFETLYDEIFEVTLPSMLWGVHRDPEREFIGFSCFDIGRMQNVKSVSLSSTGHLQIALNGKVISNQKFSSELTTEFLSNVLNEVDETRFCVNWCDKKDCGLIAVDDSQLCEKCS